MKSSTIAQKLNLQQLMISLKMLNQQIDQSKEETFSPHFADDNVSNVSVKNDESKGSIRDKAQASLVEICRKQTHSQWAHGHDIPQVAQLKQINRKLFEDNRALIKQCIKLRKIVRDGLRKQSFYQSQSLHNIELKNLEYQSQLNRLKIENIELKLSVNTQTTNKNEKHKYVEWLEQLKNSNDKLTHKIQELIQIEKVNKLTRSNTTTITSRAEEYDRDRAMTNIKIVYEDKIKVLENQLSAHKQEIIRLTRPNGVDRKYQSPIKTKHYIN